MAAFLVGVRAPFHTHTKLSPFATFLLIECPPTPTPGRHLAMSELPGSSDALLKMTLNHDTLAETQFSSSHTYPIGGCGSNIRYLFRGPSWYSKVGLRGGTTSSLLAL